MQTMPLYEQDFYAWTQQQTDLLRSGKWELLDIDNLIEEIESLGQQQRQELRNRLGILLGHLLKWHYQPEARSRSWWATIREQRREITLLLKENPSLKPYLNEAVLLGFENGMDLALRETSIPRKLLPESCPFSIEDILEQPIKFDEDEPCS